MEKQTKNQLRKTYLEKRDGLNAVTRARDSAIIRHRVLHHPEWRIAETILTYVSIRSEVETLKLIQEAFAQKKRVVVPVIDPDRKHISLSELRAVGDLAAGKFHGIPEPAAAMRTAVQPSEIELALIPGTAFDRQGGRLGFGGGYFDRLLAEMSNARRLALAYSVQLHPWPLPLETHDVPMHLIVTEKEIISVQ
jgi:5-formyltetrahydrofolate cyclo-ligase